MPEGQAPASSSLPAAAGPIRDPDASARTTLTSNPDRPSGEGPNSTSQGLPPQPSPPQAAAVIHSASGEPSALERHRDAVLGGPCGKAPIVELIRGLVEISGGPGIQQVIQALALRKAEALPVVKTRLKDGDVWEKAILGKFLAHCPWPECIPELVAIVQDDTQHWLARQGAVSALAALDNTGAGPNLVALLREPDQAIGLRLAALAAVARIGYREGIPELREFVDHEDPHLRLFAARALAELGERIDLDPLRVALDHEDYVVRLEACDVLGAVRATGDLLTDRLRVMAREDFHEAVRSAAQQALLRQALRGQTPPERIRILGAALKDADRLTALWVVRKTLQEGTPEARVLVEAYGARDDWLGERCRAHLILAPPRQPSTVPGEAR
ncbi:MAG: HEAT repeat domain-containing protein [Akkermansiaceae bacterium]|nr:HEAT repeat domain-containing protein [Akkermansiaceae bacterium]